jgi:ATP-dependent Clp protease adapter protein ClpS
MSRPPLAGVRILAASQFGAGPFGTSRLADLGAEIVTIEDPVPPYLGDRDSLYFQSFNRGKKSLPLNLRHPGGQAVVHDLVRVSDALVNDMRGEGRRAPRSHRMSASPRLARETEAPDVAERDAVDTELAPPWMTILHNCDCHTFEQVVRQLMKAIACTEEKGWEIAWQVHNTGKAVVKVAPEAECVRVGGILASIGLIVTVVQS